MTSSPMYFDDRAKPPQLMFLSADCRRNGAATEKDSTGNDDTQVFL